MSLDRRRISLSRRPGKLALASVAAAAALSSGLWAAPAEAYCRSTTCSGDCARDEDGCKTAGKPLYWASSCVGFSLQQDASEHIPMKYARPPLVASFVEWSDVPCPDGGTADIRFTEAEEAVCARAEYNLDGPNANIILFQDTKWRYKGVENNVAKTTVTFDEETGEILDADIEINHANNYFTISDTDVEFDLQSVVTHEVGHFIGLDHTPDFDATMFAGYDKGTIETRSLEEDDSGGLCAIYPPGRAEKCITKPKGGFSADCGDTGGSSDPAEEEGCTVSARTFFQPDSASEGRGRGPSGLPMGLMLLGLLVATVRRKAAEPRE